MMLIMETIEGIFRRIVREELAAALTELERAPEPEELPDSLSEADVAAYTGLSRSTLANWRSAGIGPPFVHVGRMVRYGRDELQAWLPSHAVRYLAVDEAAARASASGDDSPRARGGCAAWAPDAQGRTVDRRRRVFRCMDRTTDLRTPVASSACPRRANKRVHFLQTHESRR